MENVRPMYGLNAQQFKQVLAILQRERQVHTPSPWQEKTFKFLNFAIYGFGILVIIYILYLIVYFRLIQKKSIDLEKQFVPSSFHFIILIIAGSFFFLLAIGIAVLFFLNLPYLRQFLCENKLIRRLGLLDAIRAPWKTERRKKRLLDAMDLGVRGLVLLIAVSILTMSIKDFLNKEFNLISFLMLFIFIVVSIAIIVTYFIRRSKERLGFVSRLYSSLEECKEGAEQGEDIGIHIPRETYEKIAEIERAQISTQRVKSILRGLDEAGGCYLLQKSREVQEAQAKLDVTTRLRVQDQIDDLTTDPRPSGVTEDPEAGILHIQVPETSIILGYTIDEKARRIQILSVESTSDNAESSSKF